MTKTLYIIPAFIVVDNANNIEEANEQAAKHQTMKNGSVLLLDEELPTVAYVPEAKATEYPHAMRNIPALKKYLK